MIELQVLNNEKYDHLVAPVLRQIHDEHIIPRIWDFDYTVWKPEPTEIINRLGWLRIADAMQDQLDDLKAFANSITQEGYTHVVLLGMGGSSLASDVFRRVFERRTHYLHLSILDSTDPDAVMNCQANLPLTTTLYIVATKSGGTAETLSFFKHFYNTYLGMMESHEAGRHFVAITDPGSKLDILAQNLHFRRIFRNDDTIGGRFSVLSYFGLVPAALMGVDIHKLVIRAKEMMALCRISENTEGNPSVILGGTLGALAGQNINKVTFIASSSLAPFGDWVEQLIAESTGKEGKGLLPVVDEPIGNAEEYGPDRLFIILQLRSETCCDETVQALSKWGFTVIKLILDDLYDLGGLFFLWEMATAITGYCLGIQPFDQPNVEMAKRLARVSIDQYTETGQLTQGEYDPLSVDNLLHFLSTGKSGDYVSIQAYVAPTPEVDKALGELQIFIRTHTHLPVTKGYGPRFLHSTGQLHKGDAGRGLFIQLVSENQTDVPIPDEPGNNTSSMTFGVLKIAQAMGDFQALSDVHRRAIRFLIRGDIPGAIRRLMI